MRSDSIEGIPTKYLQSILSEEHLLILLHLCVCDGSSDEKEVESAAAHLPLCPSEDRESDLDLKRRATAPTNVTPSGSDAINIWPSNARDAYLFISSNTAKEMIFTCLDYRTERNCTVRRIPRIMHQFGHCLWRDHYVGCAMGFEYSTTSTSRDTIAFGRKLSYSMLAKTASMKTYTVSPISWPTE